jgi:hypothetical protein
MRRNEVNEAGSVGLLVSGFAMASGPAASSQYTKKANVLRHARFGKSRRGPDEEQRSPERGVQRSLKLRTEKEGT